MLRVHPLEEATCASPWSATLRCSSRPARRRSSSIRCCEIPSRAAQSRPGRSAAWTFRRCHRPISWWSRTGTRTTSTSPRSRCCRARPRCCCRATRSSLTRWRSWASRSCDPSSPEGRSVPSSCSSSPPAPRNRCARWGSCSPTPPAQCSTRWTRRCRARPSKRFARASGWPHTSRAMRARTSTTSRAGRPNSPGRSKRAISRRLRRWRLGWSFPARQAFASAASTPG